MKNPLFILFAVLTLVACSETGNKGSKIEKAVEQYAAEQKINATIIVGNADSIIYQESFGYANAEQKTKIKSTTHFPLGSVTKQFTSAAVLLLQQKGKLSIDDKIGKYVNVPDCMNNVKVRNLMNHTSGIPDYWQNNIGNNQDSILQFLNGQKSLLFEPNTNVLYSNSGYFLLGKIIESVSDKTYAEFMMEFVFNPAGMTNTFVYDGQDHNIAKGYSMSGEVNEYFFTTADGGIISTAADIYKWDKVLTNNLVLTPESKAQMFEPAVLEDNTETKMSLGWDQGVVQVALIEHILGTYDDVVHHAGAMSSFGAYNQYDTEKELYVILLSNQLRPELMKLIHIIDMELY